MDFLSILNAKLKAVVERVGLESPREIFSTPDFIFAKAGAAQTDISQLRIIAAEYTCGNFISVSDLLRNHQSMWKHISFGCRALDLCTKGGVLTRGITEICGESGSGKTQILLQLSIMVQLPEDYGGLNKSAVFISTEGAFPSKRLNQINQSFNKNYPEIQINFLKNIFVEQLLEAEDLLKCVSVRLPNLMNKFSIGLIMIDSIAAVFRTETNFIKRAVDMRKLVADLLALTEKFNCAVVCVNQVTSEMDGSNKCIPCLGLAWSNLVRTRIQIFKTPKNVIYKLKSGKDCDEITVNVRKFQILYSQYCSNQSCEFLVVPEGVVDVS